ncbi:peptide deformylase 1 [Clostridium acetireducens DSM 10703]|uniref:Peptide deformylase n=1 Tax=Clostridium acetireducens DSM 10703 TaxID=1121290 RepID=A0A1E8EYF3_9CLOT|nr:peptide deformylase [Clostridium acetireducens]OFI05580.1 peptide deformylase 1 [Clostridium acetireducens DSM 10703]
MAIKEILKFQDKTLKRVSRKVDKLDKETKNLIRDLKDTLNNVEGIGLAAPQIGDLKRIIYIDLKNGMNPILLINPIIVCKIGKEKSREGCLSYPGYEGIVIRPRRVIVKGTNEIGKEVTYEARGLLAKAFCHEIDHLDGILYIDKAKKIYKIKE